GGARGESRVADLERQAESARAASSGNDPVMVYRLTQLEAQQTASQQEIDRLRARELELLAQAERWRGHAEYAAMRDRERSERSHASRSHQTSYVSRPSLRRERREEGTGEGGGEDSRAPP